MRKPTASVEASPFHLLRAGHSVSKKSARQCSHTPGAYRPHSSASARQSSRQTSLSSKAFFCAFEVCASRRTSTTDRPGSPCSSSESSSDAEPW